MSEACLISEGKDVFTLCICVIQVPYTVRAGIPHLVQSHPRANPIQKHFTQNNNLLDFMIFLNPIKLAKLTIVFFAFQETKC